MVSIFKREKNRDELEPYVPICGEAEEFLVNEGIHDPGPNYRNAYRALEELERQGIIQNPYQDIS